MHKNADSFLKEKNFIKSSLEIVGQGSYGLVFKAKRENENLVALKAQKLETVNLIEMDLMMKYVKVGENLIKHPDITKRIDVCDIFKKQPFVSKNLTEPSYHYSYDYAKYGNKPISEI